MYMKQRQNKEFDHDLSKWDVSKVQDFSYTFAGAKKFRSDLSAWNVGSATNMRFMVCVYVIFFFASNCTFFINLFVHDKLVLVVL
jgi:surface protein